MFFVNEGGKMRSTRLPPILPKKGQDGSFLQQSALNSGTSVNSTETQQLTRVMTKKFKKRPPALEGLNNGILHTKKEIKEYNKLHSRPSTSAGRMEKIYEDPFEMEKIYEDPFDNLKSEIDISSSLLEQAEKLLVECKRLTKPTAASALEVAQEDQTEFRSALQMLQAKLGPSNKSTGS